MRSADRPRTDRSQDLVGRRRGTADSRPNVLSEGIWPHSDRAAYDGRVARPHDPLAGVDRVLVDGSNLAYAIRRGAAPVPATALISRLRAAIPAHMAIEIVFDGPPEPGLRGVRIASGVTVRHAGYRTADDLLLDLARPVGDLVVTDDRGLRDALGGRGASTAGTDWLIRRFERPRHSSPTIGNRRAPARPR